MVLKRLDSHIDQFVTWLRWWGRA